MVSPHPCHLFFRPLSYPPSLMKLNNPNYFVFLSCLETIPNHWSFFFWPSLNLFHYAVSLWKGSEHQIAQNEGSWQCDYYFVVYPSLNHYNFWFALMIATENGTDVFYHILRSWTWTLDVMASSQSIIFNVNLGLVFLLWASLKSYLQWFSSAILLLSHEVLLRFYCNSSQLLLIFNKNLERVQRRMIW